MNKSIHQDSAKESNATDQLFQRIAQEELDVTTLDTRNLDEEDFHSLAVWEIQNILGRAYQAGFEAGCESTT